MGGEKAVIVCRCNDVTLDELLNAINQGIDDFELLRKYLRIGFGPCQGRGCLMIAARLFSRKTGKPLSEVVEKFTVRPPIVPVRVDVLTRGVE